MRLQVELPEHDVTAVVRLFDEAAPEVARLIFDSLADPLDTETSHACFDGHEVFCFLPPFSRTPPIQNRTMRPKPGDVMFWYAGKNEFAVLAEPRLNAGAQRIFELAFIYGEVDLRHYWEEGLHGSLVGRFEKEFERFAAVCGKTLDEGKTSLRLSQLQE